jgi:hypothetical protein
MSALTASLLAVVVALSAPASEQDSTAAREPSAVPPQPQDGRMKVPFGVGEQLTYDVKFGALKVGGGSMEVLGVESVRGREAWHTVFRVKGGTFFYRVDSNWESWVDTRNMHSLRYVVDEEMGGRDRRRVYNFFPELSMYVEEGKQQEPSVKEPLDDGSFIYFVRTVPLAVGETYEFNRYFKPDRNPVVIKVLRKESIQVPAGRFDAIVIQPIIKSKGIFSEKGKAEIWLADDPSRIVLQMKSQLSFGSLNLYLKSYRPPPGASATSGGGGR